MLRISYSKKWEADVEGTLEELQAVRQALLSLASSDSGKWSVQGDTSGDPKPFDAFLRRLEIVIAEGPTRARVTDDEVLSIIGNAECLEALASFFDVPAGAKPGWHVHYEHYDGNKWVAPDSVPLIVSLRRPTAA